MKTNPMLLIDFYKAVHDKMLPTEITKSVSYFTPRMSRIKQWDSVVMFGLQGFIKTYLIDYFNDEFFKQPFEKVILSYKRIMDATLGKDAYNLYKISQLYNLGYLPIEIVALPEGTLVPMHVPMFGITNGSKRTIQHISLKHYLTRIKIKLVRLINTFLMQDISMSV